MAKFMVVALNGPKEGEDADRVFNDWYDDVHVPELLAVDGIISARRFKVLQSNQKWPYAAVYEIETDNLPAVMMAMGSSMSPFPDVFDRENSGNLIAMEISK